MNDKLFDSDGNMIIKDSIRYVKKDLKNGNISHHLKNDFMTLDWTTKNNEYVWGDLSGACIDKNEYELVAQMVKINEENKRR